MTSGDDKIFQPSDRTLRQFAALLTVFLGLVAARFYHDGRPWLALGLAAIGVVLGPVGIVWPRAIRPVFIAWMKVVWPIGWLVSRVILATIFYAVITPVGVVFRMMQRDVLDLRRPPGRGTYWQGKPAAPDKSRYLRQF
jgi:hypothetical protein